jgi:hypothetical protein
VPPGGKLFGRDREVADLVDILTAERIVLLYSPSGAGKTSLIQAALAPRLRGEERFDVLPVMKVRLKPPPDRQLPDGVNRYVLSLLLSLDEGRTPVEELAGLTLAEYLEQRPAPEKVSGRVLIFDQFEDILTLDPMDRPVKESFFAQVGAVLRDRRWWALFAMREEFRAGLDPYLRWIPTRFSATYRLDLLEAAAAMEAIRRPAREAGVDFPESLALRLVEDLRTVRVPDERKGYYVEPVHLQLVCLRIWNRLPPGVREIREEDVEGVGNVDEALTGHYDDHVRAAAEAPGGTPVEQLRRERRLREWFGSKLIKDRVRDQVLRSQADGLDDQALAVLVNAYLIREDERRGMIWYELTHDRLIDPVLRSNAVWFEKNLSLLERQAELWKSKNQAPGFLLRGEALAEAEQWAEGNEGLSDDEKKFLEECEKARAAAQRERGMARLLRLLSAGALAAALLAAVFAVQAYRAKQELARITTRVQDELAQKVGLGKIEKSQTLDSALRADVSTEQGIQTLEKALDEVEASNEAGERLESFQTARDPVARKDIKVRYFAKKVDQENVHEALDPLGFDLDLRVSTQGALPTNAIWFGSGVPLPYVRQVAFVLIQAGINLQGIQPFGRSTPGHASMIEIGGSKRLEPLPAITPDQIDRLSREGIPPRGAVAQARVVPQPQAQEPVPAPAEPAGAAPEEPAGTEPKPVEGRAITIQCFSSGADLASVRDALEPLGLTVVFKTSRTRIPTNAIWFGPQVPIEEVRRVALALVEAGVPLQGIQPFGNPQTGQATMIQVGGKANLQTLPVITGDQIEGLSREGIPRRSKGPVRLLPTRQGGPETARPGVGEDRM